MKRVLPCVAPVLLVFACTTGTGPTTAETDTGTATATATTTATTSPSATQTASSLTATGTATTDSTSTTAATAVTTNTEPKYDYKPGWGCDDDSECAPGEKCQVCGGEYWPLCQPLAANPAQEGEPCNVTEVYGLMHDDCDAGLLCATKAATPICVKNCQNGCGDGEDCMYGLCFPACLSYCDPVDPDCPEGWACTHWIDDRMQPVPFCVPTWEGVGPGESCNVEFLEHCAPGLACVLDLPDCPGGQYDGCCTPYCYIDDPDACPGEGVECLPAINNPPPEFENLGLCMAPE